MDCAVFLYFHRYGNTDTWPAGGQLQPYLWLHRHAQLWPCGIFRRWVLRDGHAAAIDAMAIACLPAGGCAGRRLAGPGHWVFQCASERGRSEEHTSELQSLMRISYAVFCLKKKKITH